MKKFFLLILLSFFKESLSENPFFKKVLQGGIALLSIRGAWEYTGDIINYFEKKYFKKEEKRTETRECIILYSRYTIMALVSAAGYQLGQSN